LVTLDWKNLNCFTGRLLELHAEGSLGNEESAKLPRKPILCIDNIDVLNEERIEASFKFPDDKSDWSFAEDEPLEMLFQDQLDQLVGFWGARKIYGIGRALVLAQPFSMQKLWVVTMKFILKPRTSLSAY